jgi:hypothetical protein
VWHGLVEYSHTVMEAVRQQAVNGFNSFGHGGLEIGGVLYGERHADVIRVFGCAELICEHASGPGFALSPKDEAAFRELIKPPHGLRAVGWYCSHTRSGLALNPNDCAIMERFFGERSLALIVKPLRFGPMEATFYIHGIAEPGPHFSVLVAREPELETNALQPVPVLQPVPAPRAPREALPARAAAAIPMVRHRRPKRHWVWAAFACLLLVIGYIAMRPSATTAHGKEKLGLQAYGIAERQVRIEWDRQSPAIRSAKSGTLEIADGASRYAVPLSSEQLQSSTLTYARQSDAISIALRLSGGVTESVHFVAPAVKEPAPASAPPGPAAVPKAGPQEAAGESKPLAAAPPNAERRASPLRRFTLAETETAARPGSVPLPDPPAIAALSKAPASLPIALPSQPPLHMPRSGRLIWTGSLGRRSVVEFEGSASTLGSLSGGLPGVASKLAVYPAEFARDGLTVYVTDASRHNKTEPPGPLTGWNRLHFVWDPERVKQLTVLEMPGSNNQFSRLALRNDARQCSVIVVEWAVP